MWNRKECKYRAKSAVRRSYWAAVAVCFVLAFVTGEFYESTSAIHGNSQANDNYAIIQEGGVLQTLPGDDATPLDITISEGFNFLTSQQSWLFRLVAGGLFSLAAVLMLVFRYFIAFPLQVGGRRFFLVAREAKAEPFELGFALRRGHFKNTVVSMLLRDVFTTLWSCLFIIPGIVKHYEYKMIPYLLAEDPTLGHKEVFRRSRALTQGNKWRLFVLDMSFFLWRILSAFSLGLVGIFYLNPYMVATEAEVYAALRGRGAA